MLKLIILAFVVIAVIAIKKFVDAQKEESVPTTVGTLPTPVQTAVAKLSATDLNAFLLEYDAKKKKTSVAYVAWFFSAEYLYLGQPGAFFGKIAAHFLFVIPGVVWTFMNMARMPKMVAEYNASVARTALQDLAITRQLDNAV